METKSAPFPLMHQLFETASVEFQGETALVYNNKSITYRDLNHRSDQLSYTLLHLAKEEKIIGLSTTRSLEMIIGLLAILKAGKAYLPLDPNFPESRLDQIISNSKITKCISLTTEKEVFEKIGMQVIPSDGAHNLEVKVVLDQNPNACVLYTSGSTGKPKGVCVPHRGLVNFLLWQKDHSKAAPYLKTLQFCHLSFDVSIEEIFVTLITGGTLYLINDTYRLDSGNLLEFIVNNSIHRMYLPYVELQYFAEEAIKENRFPESLIEVITGGELLKITPQISHFFNSLKNCPLKNKYGPTEACIWVTELELNGDATSWPEIPTIGKPFANTQILILDDKLVRLPEGEIGEICIQGICTANGYLNEPELTANSFIDWFDVNGEKLRLYKTGDLGRYLPEGTIEFHGRRDGQVKIRGNRVELADIEVALSQQKGIQQAVVIAREDVPGKKYLAAYLVNKEGEIDIKKLRESLKELLPDYMIPSFFIQLEEVPKTASGKVDRKQLPKPEAKRPEFGILYKKPGTEIEKNITSILINVLQFDKIGIDDNFFELGGNSLLAQKTISELKHQFRYTLPIIKLYQFPTISGMANYIENNQLGNKPQSNKININLKKDQEADIAVIAMSGRFPGANSIGQLWEVLTQGRETIKFFTEEELDQMVPQAERNDPMYVKARGIVDDADMFDADFFGINSRLAALMDPQQRIFMEISWEALENAGYHPQNGHGNIGVFAGSYNNTYYLNNVQHNKYLVDQVGEFQVMSANEKDYIASRAAFHINLKGPAISVYSACSTSLLAISQAVESLRKGQCEMALAGGASINSPVNVGHLYQEGAILSADGHCRPFDAHSTGTLFSDGAGVVLLKPLDRAKEDGDRIFAVIKGVGVNNDGGEKGSFTAPSSEGQAGAINMAINDAQIDPATISYVEAHGTGTPLGDPIEMEGLSLAFGPQEKKQYCAIGSIKSNLGHLTAAAGVAGFIKTVLALYHRQIPPSLGYESPNPNIDFENSPFYVNKTLQKWQSDTTRRAGVSSFGVGGTNVHVVLEEYRHEEVPSDIVNRPHLITWSAKSLESREGYGSKLLDFANQNPTIQWADVAYTLQTTRASFNHRRYVVGSSKDEMVRELSDSNLGMRINSLNSRPGEVIFSFPGQGAQYLNMGKGLYEEESVYKNAVDTCAEILKEYMGNDIRKVIFPEVPDQDAEDKLKNTFYTQPAMFVTEYALAKLWMSWGIQPTILCGHSIGEFVAAHLAGIFNLKDALKAIAARGMLISKLPKGSMLSVRSSMDTITKLLPEELSIAAINTHNVSVVSGPDEYIAMFAQKLDQHDIPNRILKTSHAFHSSMMDSIVDDYKELIASISLHNPQKPIISTVTGTWLKDEQATDPAYWAEHIRKTVRFADALDSIFALDHPLFIEVGPGNVTSSLAKQQNPKNPQSIINSMDKNQTQTDLKTLLNALGQVWLNGIDPDWKAFYGHQKRATINLPNYSFNKKRFWVEAHSVMGNHQVEKPLPIPLPPSSLDKQEESLTRIENLQNKVKDLLKATGIEMGSPDMSFLEMGLDSLLLTQVALTFKKEFNIPLTFRQLNENYSTPSLLVKYIDQQLPLGLYQNHVIPAHTDIELPFNHTELITFGSSAPNDLFAAMELINQQLQQLSQQMVQIQSQLIKSTSVNPSSAPSMSSKIVEDEKLINSVHHRVKENKLQEIQQEPDSFQENNADEDIDNYFSVPPVPGARLGKDLNGNPAWFIADPDKEGGYIQLIE